MANGVRLGDLEIHRVIEEENPLFDPLTFFPTLTDELLHENRPWLQQSGALDQATGRIVLCIQSYIVKTPHHTILVDSCVGNDKPRPGRPFWHMKSGDTYMRALAGTGVGIDDIDFVMCTHLHVDHVGWNTRLDHGRWVPTFPNARYIFSERELAYWMDQHASTPNEVIADSVLPVVEAGRADLVGSDFALDDHVRLVSTPGHTPDHFAVEFGASGPRAVMSGDLMHSPLQARYPDLSMRVDIDPLQAAATRRRFLEQHCDGTLVCTGHFPSPSMGRFTRWGDGFRFSPVEL